MNILKNIFFVFSIFLILGSVAEANEVIVQKLPKGYVIGHNAGNDSMRISEYVKNGETVENWSELFTTIMYNLLHNKLDPVPYLENMENSWKPACTSVLRGETRLSEVNGYKAATALIECKSNLSTGKPEYTVFKAIKGASTFYVFQKSFRFIPTKEQLSEAWKFLDEISICEGGSKDHPC